MKKGKRKNNSETTPKMSPSDPRLRHVPDSHKQHIMAMDDGEMKKINQNVMYWYQLPKCHTDEERIERIRYFLERCADRDELPTIEKLSVALGVTHYDLRMMEWAKGQYGEQLAVEVRNAKEVIKAIDAELAAAGVLPAMVYRTRAVNYYSFKEHGAVRIEGDPLKILESPDEIMERITADIADVDYEIIDDDDDNS